MKVSVFCHILDLGGTCPSSPSSLYIHIHKDIKRERERAHQHSPDQMKTPKRQSAQTNARAVGVAYDCNYTSRSINRVYMKPVFHCIHCSLTEFRFQHLVYLSLYILFIFCYIFSASTGNIVLVIERSFVKFGDQ